MVQFAKWHYLYNRKKGTNFITFPFCLFLIYNVMSSSDRKNPVCEKVCVTLPLGAPMPEGCLLEANAKFRDEILAFRPQELLSECK
jgi:hypothetical protein